MQAKKYYNYEEFMFWSAKCNELEIICFKIFCFYENSIKRIEAVKQKNPNYCQLQPLVDEMRAAMDILKKQTYEYKQRQMFNERFIRDELVKMYQLFKCVPGKPAQWIQKLKPSEFVETLDPHKLLARMGLNKGRQTPFFDEILEPNIVINLSEYQKILDTLSQQIKQKNYNIQPEEARPINKLLEKIEAEKSRLICETNVCLNHSEYSLTPDITALIIK